MVFLSGFGVASFYLWVISAWSMVTLVSGLLSIFFMLYVFMSSIASERAQRLEDADAIRDVRRLVNRCGLVVNAIERMLELNPDDKRVTVALQQLGASMARFTAGYRRYIKDEAAADAGEAEHAALLAQISGIGDVAGYMTLMRERIARIRNGTRDVDDPRLVAARRKI